MIKHKHYFDKTGTRCQANYVMCYIIQMYSYLHLFKLFRCSNQEIKYVNLCVQTEKLKALHLWPDTMPLDGRRDKMHYRNFGVSKVAPSHTEWGAQSPHRRSMEFYQYNTRDKLLSVTYWQSLSENCAEFCVCCPDTFSWNSTIETSWILKTCQPQSLEHCSASQKEK